MPHKQKETMLENDDRLSVVIFDKILHSGVRVCNIFFSFSF